MPPSLLLQQVEMLSVSGSFWTIDCYSLPTEGKEMWGEGNWNLFTQGTETVVAGQASVMQVFEGSQLFWHMTDQGLLKPLSSAAFTRGSTSQHLRSQFTRGAMKIFLAWSQQCL